MHTTSDGLKYRVVHARREPLDGETGKVSQFGGETVVTLVDDDKEPLKTESGHVVAGIAYCRADETFWRNLGRTIALGRARKMLETGVPQDPPWFLEPVGS